MLTSFQLLLFPDQCGILLTLTMVMVMVVVVMVVSITCMVLGSSVPQELDQGRRQVQSLKEKQTEIHLLSLSDILNHLLVLTVN